MPLATGFSYSNMAKSSEVGTCILILTFFRSKNLPELTTNKVLGPKCSFSFGSRKSYIWKFKYYYISYALITIAYFWTCEPPTRYLKFACFIFSGSFMNSQAVDFPERFRSQTFGAEVGSSLKSFSVVEYFCKISLVSLWLNWLL